MHLLAIGLNHRTAPLHVRERLAITRSALPEVLRALRADCALEEAVVLSTCNRVEIYGAVASPAAVRQRLTRYLISSDTTLRETLPARLYWLNNRDAVAHLFRVAAGLDSMVLGESEITAQVKQSYLAAQDQQATGPVLNRLFQKALHCAKTVRSQTRVAEGTASIGSIVITLARRVFGDDLSMRSALLWGAGKAAETTARHLVKHGVGRLWVVNRTMGRAQELALLCQGGWLSWEQARRHLASVDIAIVCTQAPHYVIDRADLEAIRAQRGGRSLCLIDLAVPRNVDPAVTQTPGVQLYNIDDLQRIAQTTLTQRQHEVARCEELIEEQVGHFDDWWHVATRQEEDSCVTVGM